MSEYNEAQTAMDTRERVFSPDSHDVFLPGDPIASLVYQGEDGSNDIEFPIYAGKEFSIGRLDERCDFFIPDSRVSKRHFRIYSVIYDKEKCNEFQPLIYCEDLESTNGTFVNDICIGMIGSERVGHLLTPSDIIEIKPHWRFRFYQPGYTSIPQGLTQLQDLQHFRDRYIISDRVLGKGQYGSVCLAAEVSTFRQLACKIVNLKEAADSLAEHSSVVAGKSWQDSVDRAREGIKLVMREINILSKLSHPNIVNLQKTFCSNTHLYIFTELAPGGDLFSYIDSRGGKLDDLQSRVISRQIVLAIKFMHQQGIAHRDIKPENVLIMHTDLGGRVVLTDFGFANYIHQSSGRLLSRLGTTGFIAPEVESADGDKRGYTMAADLWSLGVLTACLLTGYSIIPREEFSQFSQKEIAYRFLGIHDAYTREQWQSLSPRALDFLRGLLLINPEKRITAVQALHHSWFTEPSKEALLLEEGYQRVIRFWRKRDENEQVMEDLPGRTTKSHTDVTSTVGPRFRRKFPDASSSPYFGLDRHLHQKSASNRKNILNQIKSSGNRFLTSGLRPKTAGAIGRVTQQEKGFRVASVDGKDIFGSSSNSPALESVQYDPDEISLVPTTPVPRVEKNYGFKLSDALIPEISQPRASSQVLGQSQSSFQNRARIESENEEEKRMRDEVAKTIPKYSTAKVLKDEVTKKRLEIQLARLRARHSPVPT